MTLLLKQIFMFFRMLNSDTGTNQLAAGLAAGIMLGFSPILSLQGILIILICIFFRVQMGAAFISAFFFKFIAFLFDPAADQLGRMVLETESLRPLFTELYNMPLVPLTRFNNSIVMGSAVTALLLLVPAFFGFKAGIVKYRATVVARYQNSKLWKLWTGTIFYKWYAKYEALYG